MTRIKCEYCGTINKKDFGLCDYCGGPIKAAPTPWLSDIKLPFTFRPSLFETRTLYPVVGVDISKWQGKVDFDVLKKKVHFLYMRSSIGNTTVDTQFHRNYEESKRVERVFGCYHYVKPATSWSKQAATFVSLVGESELPPVADVEESGGLNKIALESWLYKFTQEFENAAQRELGFYSSPGFWNSHMPMTNWAKNKMLFNAHWTTLPSPTIPREWSIPGKTWTFWQHSADGNGKGAEYGVQSRSLDLDRFNGDLAKFNSTFGTNVQPLPVEGVMVPERIIITTAALNMRRVPTTSNNVRVAKTFRNILWETTGELATDTYGREWIQVKGDLWVARWLTRDG